MSNLTSTFETASAKEKLGLSAKLLSGIASPLKQSSGMPVDVAALDGNGGNGGLTVCELARIALAQAIITEALACGPGE